MAAVEAMQMSTTIGIAEDWQGSAACAAVTEREAIDDLGGSPWRGLSWGLALSSVLWTLLILGGREIWVLLH